MGRRRRPVSDRDDPPTLLPRLIFHRPLGDRLNIDILGFPLALAKALATLARSKLDPQTH